MPSQTTNRLFQAFTTLLLLAGWLVLSSHCALASFASEFLPKQDHRCCQSATLLEGSGTSDEGEAPGQRMPCCDALQVAAPDTLKLPSAPQSALAVLPLMLMVLAETSFSETTTVSLASFEAGPPLESLTFAERVLQGCLRAHAPPVA